MIGADSPAKRFRRSASAEITTNIAVAYIGKIAAKPGVLLMAECIKYGVPPGPLLARLKEGYDIQLNNGKIVRSVDVCGPKCPGPVFIVVECPSVAHLDSLVNNERFAKHQQSATEDDNRAELVIHFTPKNVLTNPKYQKWMDKFSASTTHWILNDSNNNPASEAIYRIQAQLNMIDETMFPLLPAQVVKNISTLTSEELHGEPDFKIVFHARPLQKYFLRPPKKFVDDVCFNLDNEAYRAEVFENEGFKVCIFFGI